MVMSELKPGDRVEVVKAEYFKARLGQRGTIAPCTAESTFKVMFDDGDFLYFSPDKLKLIPSEQPPMTDQATWTIPTDIEIKELDLGGTAKLPATVTRFDVRVGDVVKWIEDLPGQYAGSCECIGFRPDKRPVMYHTETSDLFVWFTGRESMPLISRPTAQPSERMKWNDPRLHVEGARYWIAFRVCDGITCAITLDEMGDWNFESKNPVESDIRIFRIVEASK
jgi:hypothetical protein